ncbi:lytic transglycosylase domain-containing protein [Paenibacillus sp. NPDC058071]|uniref:lytic transglycosylase domain-containing protein n=1 Tax=Paenibacillus sp. NPDC058071 TaxID=3346326 RepID=UPI0036DCE27B
MSIQSVDPRTLKQMIQLQIAQSLDSNSSTSPLSATSEDGTSLFDTLLAQYANGNANGEADATTDPSAMLAQLSALPNLYGALPAGNLSAAGSAGANSDYESLIAAASAKYGVNPLLVKSVIRTESGFNANAVSSAGAKGLMQLMDGTARSLGVTDSFDPQQNIEGGTRYLAYLLGKYNGNEQVALAAYNAGPGRIDRLGISTNAELAANAHRLPDETRRYVTKVLQAGL